ncbi:hypothetical protein IG631_14325 [Alternaria alternata]|nr:hypothetical protein IG631_14325 [Alternaria alternata]
MAMERVDGFCFWNIDVPLPTANPILALLTTCLVMVNVWMDLTSHALERFVSWVFNTMNVLSRMAETAASRREQPRGSRPSTPFFDHEPQTLDDTKAQVILPEALSKAEPNSYVVVLDCSERPLESSKTPVVNIDASTDFELFKALRVWQGLRSRSLTGAIWALFWPTSAWLELDLVCLDTPKS